jgi:transposase
LTTARGQRSSSDPLGDDEWLGIVVKLGVPMTAAPWVVSDESWELVEPLLPKRERSRPGGRIRLPHRQTLSGILFVLYTGIAWRHLPTELGFGSGVTCWRRLDEWQRAGVWEKLHALLLERLRAAGKIGWRRAVVDTSHVPAKKGGAKTGPSPSTADGSARSLT